MSALPVMATGPWKNNAEMIRDGVVPLGYLDRSWVTLDATWGLGRFWRFWQPDRLIGSDLVGGRDLTADATRLPFPDGAFDAVVLDPPYKLNGTSHGTGPATGDADYGVADDWGDGWEGRHALIRAMITDATRVLRPPIPRRGRRGARPGGILLVKCQDQVCGGRVRWQTREFADHAESLGHRLVDRFDLRSYRAQPAGRRQVHARRDTSSLLVLRYETVPDDDLLPLGDDL